MSKGSQEKEHKFDQQCDFCGLWFRKRGVNSHESNCSENPAQKMLDENSNPEDIMPDKPEEPESEESEPKETEIEEVLSCPDCGNPDDGNEPKVYYADSVLENHKEDLPKSDIQTLAERELICGDCRTVFDS